MRHNRVLVTTMSLLILAMMVMTACASGQAPSTAPTTTSKPPSASPAADSLAQIIEGAKKEGVVTCAITASYTPADVVKGMQKGIKEKYGVDLNITMSGSEGYGDMLAQVLMEQASGLPASWDVQAMTDQFLADGFKKGAFLKVDWKSILQAPVPAGVIAEHPLLGGTGVVFQGTATGLMYNTTKVKAADVPKTLSGLADPKWKGKLGIFNYETHWTRWAWVLGKEKTLATLKQIMQTKPRLGSITQLNNLYLLGEVDMAFTSAGNILSNTTKGVPTAFQAIDFLDARNTYATISKNTAHPNASKLVAAWLCSPEGAKFSNDVVQKGNFLVSGNFLYDIAIQAKNQGIPFKAVDSNPGELEFLISNEELAWEKELKLIIQGG